jgi:hypothetical protein
LRPLRQLFESSCHASVLDLLCFTKSSGEPPSVAGFLNVFVMGLRTVKFLVVLSRVVLSLSCAEATPRKSIVAAVATVARTESVRFKRHLLSQGRIERGLPSELAAERFTFRGGDRR